MALEGCAGKNMAQRMEIITAHRICVNRKEAWRKHIIVTDKELIRALVDVCEGQQWIATAPVGYPAKEGHRSSKKSKEVTRGPLVTPLADRGYFSFNVLADHFLESLILNGLFR